MISFTIQHSMHMKKDEKKKNSLIKLILKNFIGLFIQKKLMEFL